MLLFWLRRRRLRRFCFRAWDLVQAAPRNDHLRNATRRGARRL